MKKILVRIIIFLIFPLINVFGQSNSTRVVGTKDGGVTVTKDGDKMIVTMVDPFTGETYTRTGTIPNTTNTSTSTSTGSSFAERSQAAYKQNEADIAVDRDKISNINDGIGTLVDGGNIRVKDRFGGNNRVKNNKEPIAYIGKSRIPIYKNPSDLIVNTQKDEPITYEFSEEYRRNMEEVTQMIEEANREAQLKYTDITPENIVKKANPKIINNAPWDEIYNTINNHQRFSTIIGFMNTVNNGVLPQYDKNSSTKNGYVFFGNNKCFVLSADGSSLVYYETSDKKGTDYLKVNSSLLSLEFKGDSENKLQGESQGFSVSAYLVNYDNYSEAKLKYIELYKDGGAKLGAELTSRSGYSGEVGGSASVKGLSASVSVDYGSIKLTTPLISPPPKMQINDNNSVNFVQNNVDLSVKLTAGMGVGLKDGELKLLFLSVGMGINKPDIDGAIKQIAPNVAIKMISDYVADDGSLIPNKYKLQGNPQPATYAYNETVRVVDKTALEEAKNRLRESISNLSR